MTLGEALATVLNTIDNINVPISMHQQIGAPLANAAELLAECTRLVLADEAKNRNAPEEKNRK